MKDDNMDDRVVIPTLNEAETPSESEAGKSSIPDTSMSSSELVGTIMPDTDPEEANNTEVAEEDATEKEEGASDDKDKKESDGDDKLERFDKHPRFQELKAERDAAIERAARAEAMAETRAKAEPTEVAPDYIDITGMDPEDLSLQINEDPIAFAINLGKQIRSEILSELAERNQKETIQQRVNTTYDKYAGENPDFQMMLDSGEIRNFINQNPGHNAISAHLSMTRDVKLQEIESKYKTDMQKAVTDAQKKAAENQRIKRSAAVLNEDSTAPSTVRKGGIPPELKNTKTVGGPTSALVKRLLDFRESRQ